jgi:hypothetical protein
MADKRQKADEGQMGNRKRGASRMETGGGGGAEAGRVDGWRNAGGHDGDNSAPIRHWHCGKREAPAILWCGWRRRSRWRAPHLDLGVRLGLTWAHRE